MSTRLIRNLAWHWQTKRTRLLYGMRLGKLGHGAVVDCGARVQASRSIGLGAATRIYTHARIRGLGHEGEHIDVGSDCQIAEYAVIESSGGYVEIGDNVYVGRYTYIGGHGGCRIGNDCQIAEFCYIIAANHEFEDRSKPIRLQGHSCKGITVGDDCWLGNGVTILDGVTVGRGAVLAAHAVVTRDVPDYAVVGGVPARILRFRGEPK